MRKVLVINCNFINLKYRVYLGQTSDSGKVLGVRILTQHEYAANVVACIAKILSDEGFDVVNAQGFVSQEALRESLKICSEQRDRVLRLVQQLNWYHSKQIQLRSNDGINIYLTYEE